MKFKNLSISKKMMIMALVPGISYLIIAGRLIYQDLSNLDKDEELRVRVNAMQLISDVISETQVERGRSVVFLKSGTNDNSLVLDQRNIANTKWEALKDSISKNPVLEEFGDITDIFGDIAYARSQVDTQEDFKRTISVYTESIESLIKIFKNLGNNTTENLQAISDNNVILQVARENAGLLRANLSGTFAANKKISLNQLSTIEGYYNRMTLTLGLPTLSLSHDTQQIKDKLGSESHWQFVEAAVSLLKNKFTKGEYGTSSSQTFKNASSVVNDISSVIQANLLDGIKEINRIHRETVEHLVIQSTGLIINLILIAIIPWFFIRSIHEKIDGLIKNLSTLSENSQNSSESLNDASNTLALGAQETAASIQETVSSMSEINSMVGGTLEKSKLTRSSSQLVEQRVSKGAETVGQLVEAMYGIKEANERLGEINGVMKAISKQTGLINDIVFKTQLLAVNASIESAKAGEHGRGFSVVSEEVSKLAQSSGEAAAKITELIDTSNERVASLLKSINERVASGTEYTDEVQSLFQEIRSEVKDINSRAQDMNHAAKEQSLGIEQVTTAVSNIDQSTQRNLKEIHKFERLTTTLSRQSKTLLNLSNKLEFLAYGKDKANGKDQDNTPKGLKNIQYVNEVEVKNNRISTISQDIEIPSNDIDLADDPSFRPAAND